MNTELTAGREMDAMVAERITHWKPLGISTDYRGVPFPEECPHYSTDLAAAWRVVERIVPPLTPENPEREWEFKLDTLRNGFRATFLHKPTRTPWPAESARMPEAICKAALMAMEVV